ncbi:hypothetical protein VP01_1162g5 [Puccinia sorghi]|uniref:Uncharacterized protein n=1 Tax=Puccinia sorghi TaxID=27349 RepID=A0A0L6VRG7_9BASI|nr:hypothetical protein VP01_1162g5 [Puccinia sorghi]
MSTTFLSKNISLKVSYFIDQFFMHPHHAKSHVKTCWVSCINYIYIHLSLSIKSEVVQFSHAQAPLKLAQRQLINAWLASFMIHFSIIFPRDFIDERGDMIYWLVRVRLSKQLLRRTYELSECPSGSSTRHRYTNNKGVVLESNLVFPSRHLKCFEIKVGMMKQHKIINLYKTKIKINLFGKNLTQNQDGVKAHTETTKTGGLGLYDGLVSAVHCAKLMHPNNPAKSRISRPKKTYSRGGSLAPIIIFPSFIHSIQKSALFSSISYQPEKTLRIPHFYSNKSPLQHPSTSWSSQRSPFTRKKSEKPPPRPINKHLMTSEMRLGGSLTYPNLIPSLSTSVSLLYPNLYPSFYILEYIKLQSNQLSNTLKIHQPKLLKASYKLPKINIYMEINFIFDISKYPCKKFLERSGKQCMISIFRLEILLIFSEIGTVFFVSNSMIMLQPSFHPNSTFCTVNVHQNLVKSLWEKGESNTKIFVGISACQLQAKNHITHSHKY